MSSPITDISGCFTLHNGVQMPYFGLGVYLSKDGQQVINAIHHALDAGYRHIDTASIYNNEIGVGKAIEKSTVPRSEIFTVSKVWNTDQGYDSTLKAFDLSLNRLQLDYLDLYLVHWPVKGKFRETWNAMEQLYKEKRVRAIGVSNFMQHHLEELLDHANIVPMVNQMEFHPFLVQQSLLDFCKQHQIQYEAWSPMMRGQVFQMEEFRNLAVKYQKTVAQIVLRWNLQKGVITIPKSSQKERIVANAAIFDFELSRDDMTFLDGLDQGKRFGGYPDDYEYLAT